MVRQRAGDVEQWKVSSRGRIESMRLDSEQLRQDREQERLDSEQLRQDREQERLDSEQMRRERAA